MKRADVNMKNLSPKEKARLLSELKYLLFVEGFTQAQAAHYMSISQKTVCHWVMAMGWRDRLRAAQKDYTKLEDSLSAFIAFARIHHSELYKSLEPAYQKFLNTL